MSLVTSCYSGHEFIIPCKRQRKNPLFFLSVVSNHYTDPYIYIYIYYIMILFKQFYWLSCCHLTFRKIWYCLIKTCIDLGFTFVFHCIMYDVIMKWLISYWLGFTFTFHFNVIKQLQSFVSVNTSFYGP